MSIVIVSGALANKPGNGGGAWERMSWVIGLQRLGFAVWFVEQITPDACRDSRGDPADFQDSVNLAWFESVTRLFDIENRSSLVYDGGRKTVGLPWSQMLEIAESAALLVNLSGHLSLPPLLERCRLKAYVNVDPGFTQFWHDDPTIPFRLQGHDLYFTIAENIGKSDCGIPTCGLSWLTTRQPVVLDYWEVSAAPPEPRFTTVGSWRGAFGPVQANGRNFGVKAHQFRRFIDLPQHVSAVCELALDITAADDRDLVALRQHDWRVVNPAAVAGDAATFRAYVQGSSAEFTVAQGVYVDTHSGWFSDRSTRYLASGKPVLVQDTGLSGLYPVGQGLIVFRNLREAVAGAESILQNYEEHSRAARDLARDYFNSDRVLGEFISKTGIAP